MSDAVAIEKTPAHAVPRVCTVLGLVALSWTRKYDKASLDYIA